jgi:amphi-Trp domain-containing protein
MGKDETIVTDRPVKKPLQRRSLMAKKKKARDIEEVYTIKQTVQKLRRLADCLEAGKPFRIQIANERVYIPAKIVFGIEHEREGKTEEVEFQFKWVNE